MEGEKFQLTFAKEGFSSEVLTRWEYEHKAWVLEYYLFGLLADKLITPQEHENILSMINSPDHENLNVAEIVIRNLLPKTDNTTAQRNFLDDLYKRNK